MVAYNAAISESPDQNILSVNACSVESSNVFDRKLKWQDYNKLYLETVDKVLQ